MLTCKVGNKIINTFDYNREQIRKWSNKGLLKCPMCNEKMIYRHGEFKIPHFSHESSCEYEKELVYSHPETEEHVNGKKALYNWLKTQNVENLKLEAWIPETKQRPDIYFEYNGERYVIEYQCSPIATKYVERHNLYELAGIKDIWILGTEKYPTIKSSRGYIRVKKHTKELLDLGHYIRHFDGNAIKTYIDIEKIIDKKTCYAVREDFTSLCEYKIEDMIKVMFDKTNIKALFGNSNINITSDLYNVDEKMINLLPMSMYRHLFNCTYSSYWYKSFESELLGKIGYKTDDVIDIKDFYFFDDKELFGYKKIHDYTKIKIDDRDVEYITNIENMWSIINKISGKNDIDEKLIDNVSAKMIERFKRVIDNRKSVHKYELSEISNIDIKQLSDECESLDIENKIKSDLFDDFIAKHINRGKIKDKLIELTNEKHRLKIKKAREYKIKIIQMCKGLTGVKFNIHKNDTKMEVIYNESKLTFDTCYNKDVLSYSELNYKVFFILNDEIRLETVESCVKANIENKINMNCNTIRFGYSKECFSGEKYLNAKDFDFVKEFEDLNFLWIQLRDGSKNHNQFLKEFYERSDTFKLLKRISKFNTECVNIRLNISFTNNGCGYRPWVIKDFIETLDYFLENVSVQNIM